VTGLAETAAGASGFGSFGFVGVAFSHDYKCLINRLNLGWPATSSVESKPLPPNSKKNFAGRHTSVVYGKAGALKPSWDAIHAPTRL